MEKNNPTSDQKGNTPLKEIPEDYYPQGRGAWFVIPTGRDSGKKMFFSDSKLGSADPEETIVFVHGNPESSYLYRNIIREVESRSRKPFRLVVMDHIGFGLSDRASYEMVDMDHAENLYQLVQYLDLQNVTLIVHDWGGPIGIGAFLREPERVKNLVITNSTVFPIPQEGKTFKNYPMRFMPWSKLPYVIPFRLWGYLASFIVELNPAGSFRILSGFFAHLLGAKLGIKRLSKAQKVYLQQLSVKENVKSSKRLVLQTPFWGQGVVYDDAKLGRRDSTPFYSFIHKELNSSWGRDGQNIGVRAVLGRWDPLGKDAVIRQWIENLPQLEGNVLSFEDVGHFIEEFKPREIAEAIMDVAGLREA